MMTKTNNIAIQLPNFPDFWERVHNAGNRFLGLDYDGTLAPFAIDPMKATPLPGIADHLRNLATKGQTQIAIISGRPAAEVMTLLDNPPITIVGSHGFEFLPVDGVCVVRQPTPKQRRGLIEIRMDLQKCCYGNILETKIASLAIHTRGLDPISAIAVKEEIFTELAGRALHFDLECRCFNGGIEIRCIGWNKGDALKTLLDLQPGDALAVYIGDDDTDEDAFTEIRKRGIGIKVGESSRPTAARSILPDCRAVAAFLQTWARVTTTGRRQE
jgi:trehalose 6-phosphate phosphatase